MSKKIVVLLVSIFVFIFSSSFSFAQEFEITPECREVVKEVIKRDSSLCGITCVKSFQPLIQISLEMKKTIENLEDLLLVQKAIIKSQEAEIQYLKKKLKKERS